MIQISSMLNPNAVLLHPSHNKSPQYFFLFGTKLQDSIHERPFIYQIMLKVKVQCYLILSVSVKQRFYKYKMEIVPTSLDFCERSLYYIHEINKRFLSLINHENSMFSDWWVCTQQMSSPGPLVSNQQREKPVSFSPFHTPYLRLINPHEPPTQPSFSYDLEKRDNAARSPDSCILQWWFISL